MGRGRAPVPFAAAFDLRFGCAPFVCEAFRMAYLAYERLRSVTNSPRRVLIVEDHKALADAMRRLFERNGFEVSHARDLEGSLALLGAEQFDAVFCDQWLGATLAPPRLLDLLQARENGQRRTAFVLVSGEPEAGPSLAYADRISAWLQKPFTFDQLSSVTEKVLGPT